MIWKKPIKAAPAPKRTPPLKPEIVKPTGPVNHLVKGTKKDPKRIT